MVPSDWENRVYDTHGQGTDADKERFQNERSDFNNELVSKIRGIGHWEAIIRPSRFLAGRVSDFLSIHPIVQQNQVRHGGWQFPSMGQRDQESGNNWWGESLDFDLPESWRLYQSGQFVHFWGFGDESPEGMLSIQATVNYLTCVYEFAAKIADTEAGNHNLVVETTANNISRRALATRHGVFHREAYTTQAEQLTDIRSVTKDQLVAEAHELAVKVAKEWFNRFKWDPREGQLREMQSDFLRR